MPKEKKSKGSLRHEPLGTQIAKHEDAQKYVQPRKNVRQKAGRKNTQKRESFVSDSLSKKALDLAREQQLEEAEERRQELLQTEVRSSKAQDMSDDEENFDEDGDYEVEDIELSAEDQQALQLWMGPEQPRRTLADIIMEKIREKEMEMAGEGPVLARMDPKVVKVYKGVGKLLKKYKSGKLPKAFKMIPSLENWEEILWLTEPDSWSPAAVRAATRIFASNLNQKMAQRFYNIILLPHIRNDIESNKKLNYHLYMAIKKSIFKPAAFYKGLILPLCESRTCTLREATIIGSVIIKVTIPPLQSAVALLKIAEMDYSGANSIFIRVLLDKKYSLPYRVIDSLVEHFVRFEKEEKQLPVLWHQALLVFVQRYKEDMTPNQKSQLKHLIKHQQHYAISPEIHRELNESRSRGEAPTDKLKQLEAMKV